MATVEAWTAYAEARGLPGIGAATPDQIAEALVRASDYISLHYLPKLKTQPPAAVVDHATYIAAEYELNQRGYFSRANEPGVSNKMLTRAGELSWTPMRADRSADPVMPTVKAIEALFRPYMWRGIAMLVV